MSMRRASISSTSNGVEQPLVHTNTGVLVQAWAHRIVKTMKKRPNWYQPWSSPGVSASEGSLMVHRLCGRLTQELSIMKGSRCFAPFRNSCVSSDHGQAVRTLASMAHSVGISFSGQSRLGYSGRQSSHARSGGDALQGTCTCQCKPLSSHIWTRRGGPGKLRRRKT